MIVELGTGSSSYKTATSLEDFHTCKGIGNWAR
jgi:hypothetical protein